MCEYCDFTDSRCYWCDVDDCYGCAWCSNQYYEQVQSKYPGAHLKGDRCYHCGVYFKQCVCFQDCSLASETETHRMESSNNFWSRRLKETTKRECKSQKKVKPRRDEPKQANH